MNLFPRVESSGWIVRRSPLQLRSRPNSLRRYFASGWMFFTPYLAVYLIYHWQKWPANIAASAFGIGGILPALSQVFVALHLFHLLLMGLTMRSWWQGRKRAATPELPQNHGLVGPSTETGIVAGSERQSLASSAWSVCPWIFIAAIFAIPGIYLEWPSDPWEHVRRITEWGTHSVVGQHSAGYKSFYFFAYSFVGSVTPLNLLGWLEVYYVGMCLLLTWQYHLLGKAIGLDRRWALVFVLVNALTSGNSCFSFYRYYGLATTIVAQIGAVALIRFAIDVARGSIQINGFRHGLIAVLYCGGLILLITFNHVQGLGIAGLGVAAIVLWRMFLWRRSALWWSLGLAAVLSLAANIWWPFNTASYQSGGWLNAANGFDFFSWKSVANERAVQILGAFGLANLGAGTFLMYRGHPAGWLTFGPVLLLSFSCITLPLIGALTTGGAENILTYHRMFLAIPSGLALVVVARSFALRLQQRLVAAKLNKRRTESLGFATLVLAAALAVLLPSNGPYFNRTWQALMQVPSDLAMRHVWDDFAATKNIPAGSVFAAPADLSFIHSMQKQIQPLRSGRLRLLPDYDVAVTTIALYNRTFDREAWVVISEPRMFTAPYSFAAITSQHWAPQAGQLSSTGAAELKISSPRLGFTPQQEGNSQLKFWSRPAGSRGAARASNVPQ